VVDVGAHKFRKHFGYYMEQARQGAEVLVSKRGRPFVRLLGAAEPMAPESVEAMTSVR
jgi:prevent-host-death family protein